MDAYQVYSQRICDNHNETLCYPNCTINATIFIATWDGVLLLICFRLRLLANWYWVLESVWELCVNIAIFRVST